MVDAQVHIWAWERYVVTVLRFHEFQCEHALASRYGPCNKSAQLYLSFKRPVHGGLHTDAAVLLQCYWHTLLSIARWSPPPFTCTHSAPSQLCVSDSLGQVSILQRDGCGLLKQTSACTAHSYETWVAAFDCWDHNTLYSGSHTLTTLPLLTL